MRSIEFGLSLFIPVCALLALGACTREETAPPATSMTASPASNQIAAGQALFGEKCAKCHGDSGEGKAGKAPPVVGAAALPMDPPAGAKHRNVQFHTAADVFAWVKTNMPGDAPGSLSDEQVAAILAFDLKANGVDVRTMVDATSAPTIVLHP